MHKRVTDLITISDVQQWKDNDIITIQAGTGVGKSYFIKNVLYNHAKVNNKKILFLIHRTNCVNQFQMELVADKKTDVIKIMTYQSIENFDINSVKFNFNNYDYIVCDEFHYFMSDAAFNKYTDISLNGILNSTNNIKIFMSATGEYMKKFIHKASGIESINYELPIQFDFIDKLWFFHKEHTLDEFIKLAIKNNIKTIFFIESVEKAYALYKKFEEYCIFNCSKHNKKYYKYVDQLEINQMLNNQRFEKLILITTTCMDAGVNIIDRDLQHIVCDVHDTGTLIQCIGRKRIIDDNDKLNLFIKAKNNKQLGAIKSQTNRKMKQVSFLREYGIEKYISKYGRNADKHAIIYDDLENGKLVKQINKLIYFKCRMDIKEIDIMINSGKYGYCTTLQKIFKKDKYYVFEEKSKVNEINEYMDSLVGKRLLENEREELINKIELKDKFGRIHKSIKMLNAYFEENEMEYMIVSKRTSKTENGEKTRYTYWEVLNNISDRNN